MQDNLDTVSEALNNYIACAKLSRDEQKELHEAWIPIYESVAGKTIGGRQDEIIGVQGSPCPGLHDHFIVSYDNKKLVLVYENELFEFDLNHGDIGEFWGSFTQKDGTPRDINFHQENDEQEPTVEIYELDWDETVKKYKLGNSLDILNSCFKSGDPRNYFDGELKFERYQVQEWFRVMVGERSYEVNTLVSNSGERSFERAFPEDPDHPLTMGDIEFIQSKIPTMYR